MSQNTSSFRFIIIRQFCLAFRFMAYMHMHIGPFIWTVLFFSRGNQMTIKEECKLHSSIEEMSLNLKQVFLPINSAEMKNICAEELNRRLSTLSIQEVNQKLQAKHDSEFQKCIHIYFEMIEFSTLPTLLNLEIFFLKRIFYPYNATTAKLELIGSHYKDNPIAFSFASCSPDCWACNCPCHYGHSSQHGFPLYNRRSLTDLFPLS